MSRCLRAWSLPAETVPQKRVWMGFPPAAGASASAGADLDAARRAWAEVAHAIADYEPVTMLVDPADQHTVEDYVSPRIERLACPLDDAWLRDTGPSFVLDAEGRLGAVDWHFNGWGARPWARWDKDAAIAGVIAQHAGAERIISSLVNEGGGLAGDGAGTLLLTETVQRDPRRNPGLSRAAVEAEMKRTLGADHMIWLERGLTRDAEPLGTFGHVDIVAALPAPGHVLVHDQRNPRHPDHAISQAVIAQFAQARTRDDTAFVVHRLPAPQRLHDEHGPVDYSYINHLPINGAVVLGTFDDPADDEAAEILAAAYPGREIVRVDARPIFARGGGVHCITQQEPRARDIDG
ncbi:agmatine/peptidylarginine deiminase [Salinisphaera sp. Q1T1-3]|uniref:agmatine deiminase family protein n=1 Tax=Salinisphaera sp. Q1T1-3 TaxID=2321229 RepID=UPI000E754DBF|nr:agmatine deiminase family protein [Salinisphaera sp. Q1T1-3]RJS91982.1 agmatine deiminase family protein [Salinisphaera sp. Q1T1-3]